MKYYFVAILFLLTSVSTASWQNDSVAHPTLANNLLVPLTQLVMHSEEDDYVGGGRDFSYSSSDGNFTATVFTNPQSGQVNQVTLSFLNNAVTEDWYLQFSTRGLDQSMMPGIYPKAQRSPFEQSGHPGLSVSGIGHGCNGSNSKFVVLDAQFDYSVSPPQVLAFAAQFEHHCENFQAALFGTLYYNYTPTLTVTLNQSALLAGQTAVGTVTLNTPAPIGGAMVKIETTNNTLVNTPPFVFIPQGALSATFPIMTREIRARPMVQVVASYAGVANTATLTVQFPFPTLTKLTIHRDASAHGDDEFDAVVTPSQGGRFFTSMDYSPTDTPDFILTSVGGSNFVGSTLWFSTRQLNIPLRPGFYPNAQRAPFASPGHPGLDISLGSSGCNRVTGEFTVLDAVFDETFSPPQVVAFSASYKQFCEGFGIPLTGTFYYNYGIDQFDTSYDFCLQDDSSKNVLRINTTTGAYQFVRCQDGFTVGGTGAITKRGCTIGFQDSRSDRRIMANIDKCQNKASASVQIFAQGSSFILTDRNTTNNTCSCPNSQ